VEKGLQHAKRNRKVKTRNARRQWIQKINAGARNNGLKYAQLIHGMKLCNIQLNRKMLADLCYNEPLSFAGICNHVGLRKEITPKVYPAYGYVQSAVVTQKVLKPTKHMRTRVLGAFLADEKKNPGDIIDRVNFRLPMYMDYVQIEKPTRIEVASWYKQVEKMRAEERKEKEKSMFRANPTGIITSKDVPRGKVRSHWKFVPREPYTAPEIYEDANHASA